MCSILLSIKPKYANEIISGRKKFEFRKVKCQNEIDTIIIYATAPVKQVIGEVKVIDILQDTVSKIWNEAKDKAGISENEFKEYYAGRTIATAYKLGSVIKYRYPKELSDFGIHYVPQSFVYITT